MNRDSLDEFFARAEDVLTDWDETRSPDAACSTDDDLAFRPLVYLDCESTVLPVWWTMNNAHLDVPPADNNQLDRLEEAFSTGRVWDLPPGRTMTTAFNGLPVEVQQRLRDQWRRDTAAWERGEIDWSLGGES